MPPASAIFVELVELREVSLIGEAAARIRRHSATPSMSGKPRSMPPL
ncbi:MAG TPA: hypothetical protein VF482_19645 [Trebonia sp.]